jgi:hypothetical protein
MESIMDLTIPLTAAATVFTVIGSNIALMSWLRSDMKSFESKIDSWKEEINKEMKDFHGRLCSIESRYQRERFKSAENVINKQGL